MVPEAPFQPRSRPPQTPSPDPTRSTASWSSSPPAGQPRSTGDFARTLQGSGGRVARLQAGVEMVVDLLEGCDHAGVTIASKGMLSTPAASDALVRRGDEWQYELGQGPCVDSVRDQHTVIAQDLTADRRWSTWGPRVVERLGINAMMSLLLYTDTDTFGALNLYADRTQAWDHRQIGLAQSLAGHLAVAAADAAEIDHRGRAMVSRTVIGQAEGIVMERLSIDAEQAFAYLRRVSQASHRKLVDVAEDLVATRRLPLAEDDPDAGRSAGPDAGSGAV